MLTLSLLGMVNEEESLLSSTTFPLPTGLSHETLDPMLLAETAELEILYPEPVTLGIVIKAWATARGPAWARMAAALDAQYNPIHNYDRSESWTEEREGESSKAGSNDRDIESSSSGSTSGSASEAVAGYNSSQANVPKNSSTSSGSASNTASTDQSDAWSEEGSNAETVTRSGTVSGNIGVTTSQQMITAELELRKLDIYKLIIREFITMFCIGVY